MTARPTKAAPAKKAAKKKAAKKKTAAAKSPAKKKAAKKKAASKKAASKKAAKKKAAKKKAAKKKAAKKAASARSAVEETPAEEAGGFEEIEAAPAPVEAASFESDAGADADALVEPDEMDEPDATDEAGAEPAIEPTASPLPLSLADDEDDDTPISILALSDDDDLETLGVFDLDDDEEDFEAASPRADEDGADEEDEPEPVWPPETIDDAARFFGVDGLYPEQQEVIEHALDGGDALVVLPTGYGKSACFQIPSLLLPKPVVVISPLLALIEDQVKNMEARGIPVVRFDGTVRGKARVAALERIAEGGRLLVMTTPESLASDELLVSLFKSGISLFAIDEAHCASEGHVWGLCVVLSQCDGMDSTRSMGLSRRFAH